MLIDHVLYATADLDAALERLGMTAAGGGRHEGMGTENRIVPLGGGYLEVITVADPDEAASSPFGAGVAARLAAVGEGLIGWAVAVDDVDAVAQRLGTPLATIAREGLTASLTGVREAMTEPHLPFFIERGAGVEDPGAGGAQGGITALELTGDADRLTDWLGGADLPVTVTPGPSALVAVRLGDGSAL